MYHDENPGARFTQIRNRVNACLPEGSGKRNVAVLAGGAGVGYLVVLLVSPLLTRLFTADEFGAWAVFVSCFALLLPFSTLRYELAIPLPREDETAAAVSAAAVGFAIVTALAVGTFLFFWGERLVCWIRSPSLGPYLWLLSPVLFVGAAYAVLNYWAVREQSFPPVALSRVVQSTGLAAAQVGAGFAGWGTGGLLLGELAGRTSAAGVLLYRLGRGKRALLRRISVRSMGAAMLRYRRFPLFSSWAGLLNSASVQVPVLLLSSFFGSAVAGWYALSTRVLQIPVVLVGQAVTQVFYARAVEADRSGTLDEVTLRLLEVLLRLSLPGLFFVVVAGPAVFSLVFGPQWRTAGTYSRWLAPWLFLVIVGSPLSSLTSVLHRQGGEFLFQSTLLGARLAVLCGTRSLHSPETTVATFGMASMVLWLGYICWVVDISGNPFPKALALLGKNSLRYFVLFAPAVVTKWWDLPDPYMVTVALLNMLAVAVWTIVKYRYIWTSYSK